MLRRLRRPAALLALIVVPSGLLAACGSDIPGNGFDFGDRLDAVTIEGDFGEAPTVEWKERMSAGEVETTTLIEGEGEPLADGDTVFVNFVIGDGFTRSTPVDTFGEESAGVRFEVGGEPVQPNSINDLVQAFFIDQVAAGVTRGSRLAITADTVAVFGEDYALSPVLAEEGIGNDDGLLVVADVLEVEQLEAAEGEQSPLPGWAPKIEFTDGVPSGLDFEGVKKPDATPLSAVLKRGTGTAVKKGDLLAARYLGSIYDGKKPFDESYSKDKEPIARGIGIGELVKGWDQLIGLPVGSRVLLRIPPKDGYGQQDQGAAIPPGSTLYFVIDILASI